MVEEALDIALPPIDLTTGQHRVPTSLARPLGPYVDRPEGADDITTAFEGPRKPEHPAIRSRFDQLSEVALMRADRDPLQVAGQAFFITNGEPVYFWDFPRRLWRLLAPDVYPSREPFVMPKSVGFAVATLAEWWGWLSGREPTFTRFRVTFTCAHRWHNIEKARRVLGYEPQVGLEEGMRRTVEVCLSSHCSFPNTLLTPCSPLVVESRGSQVRDMNIIYPHSRSFSIICCLAHHQTFVLYFLCMHRWRSYLTQDDLRLLIDCSRLLAISILPLNFKSHVIPHRHRHHRHPILWHLASHGSSMPRQIPPRSALRSMSALRAGPCCVGAAAHCARQRGERASLPRAMSGPRPKMTVVLRTR